MQTVVWKIGTHDCSLCKKLNGVWGDLKVLHPSFLYYVANPLLDDKVLEEMKRHNLKKIPIIKVQQGSKIYYKEGVSSIEEFENFLQEIGGRE